MTVSHGTVHVLATTFDGPKNALAVAIPFAEIQHRWPRRFCAQFP